MGFFSKVGKTLKKSVKNAFRGGSMWDLVDKHIGKPIEGKIQDMMGVGALRDMAAGQEAAMLRQQEQAKLDAMSEVQNITQFEDSTGPEFTGGGSRRNKRKSSAVSSAIGLNY